LIARAIRARELSMLDVWFASLGPVASALVEGAVRGAISRTPAPPPPPKKKEPKVIEGYELVKPLGEGGIGFVWLVRKPGADRLFVLKIPKADALQNATDTERKGILASFVEEANALAGLYHPNVANIIDRGVIEGQVPYLVLEYLIGADLKHYAAAKPMTLFELRQVVLGYDVDGDEISTCTVDYVEPPPQQGTQTKKPVESLRIFGHAFNECLHTDARKHLVMKSPGVRSPEVTAVPVLRVREEFIKRWATGVSDRKKADNARRSSWSWALKNCGIGYGREVLGSGEELIWRK
jgi:hypothetical protein